MKVKKAIEICNSINAENITDDGKFEAIDTILDSQAGSMCLSKPVLFEVIGWMRSELNEPRCNTLC